MHADQHRILPLGQRRSRGWEQETRSVSRKISSVLTALPSPGANALRDPDLGVDEPPFWVTTLSAVA
jgi:hypothetical protein